MSVYIPKGRKTYHYDFEWRGHRFSGTTGAESKREALKVEEQVRKRAQAEAARKAEIAGAPMSLNMACARYWMEIGQFAKSAKQIEWSADYLLNNLGEQTLIRDIDDAAVAKLIAQRRGEHVDNFMVRRTKRPKGGVKRVSNATVNRSVIEPLKRIILRARDVWKEPVGAIDWKQHKLKEPKERVRSLPTESDASLFEMLSEAYHAITYFALRTGCRAQECINLRRAAIDWGERRITITGKGDKTATIPMPLDVRDMLFQMQPDKDGFLFLMPPIVRKDGRIFKPARRITYRAYYSALKRACERAGIEDFRIHDLRHTAATRLLQRTGNLKMVQKLLRHEDIKTTTKYAAVFDNELRDAMDEMGQQANPGHKKASPKQASNE